MDIDPGTPEERLRKAAAWAHDDDRPLLAKACLDGADEIARLSDEYARGKKHGADYRRMIEKQNQAQSREIAALKTEIGKLKMSHAKLLKAAKLGASALDAMMGDSDLDDDDSPEFKACQALNRAVDFATSKNGN